MRRMRFFASRNAREILRDPISVGFGVAFPILLLLLLSFLNRHIPAEAHMTLFEPEQLAEIYRALRFVREQDETISFGRDRELVELMEQVGGLLPADALLQRDAPEQSGMTMK